MAILQDIAKMVGATCDEKEGLQRSPLIKYMGSCDGLQRVSLQQIRDLLPFGQHKEERVEKKKVQMQIFAQSVDQKPGRIN